MSTIALDDGVKTSPIAGRSRVFSVVLPGLAAIAYPLLLSLIGWVLGQLQVTAPPDPAAITATVIAILASASAVMGVAFARALSLDQPVHQPVHVVHLCPFCPAVLLP